MLLFPDSVITFPLWTKWLHIEKQKAAKIKLQRGYIERITGLISPHRHLRLVTPDLKKIYYEILFGVFQWLLSPADTAKGTLLAQTQLVWFNRGGVRTNHGTQKQDGVQSPGNNMLKLLSRHNSWSHKHQTYRGFQQTYLWYCSCRTIKVQTTSDTQNIHKNSRGSVSSVFTLVFVF